MPAPWGTEGVSVWASRDNAGKDLPSLSLPMYPFPLWTKQSQIRQQSLGIHAENKHPLQLLHWRHLGAGSWAGEGGQQATSPAPCRTWLLGISWVQHGIRKGNNATLVAVALETAGSTYCPNISAVKVLVVVCMLCDDPLEWTPAFKSCPFKSSELRN